MKAMMVFLLLQASTSAVFANINTSIEGFQLLMDEARAQIGIGYSIQSMSTYHSDKTGHGYEIVLRNHLAVEESECFRAFHNPRTSSKRKLLFVKDCAE